MASLGSTGSAAFKQALCKKKAEKAWSYTDVARVLGCSRSTAINILRRGNGSKIKRAYADNLARYFDGALPWSSEHRYTTLINGYGREWKTADTSDKRRRLAYRLSAFVAEYMLISCHMRVVFTLDISNLAGPNAATFSLYNSAGEVSYTLQLVFNTNDRTVIPIKLFDAARNCIYRGKFNRLTLSNLITKLQNVSN
jgi:hypothetical protein